MMQTDDLTALESSAHMLDWFSSDPLPAIRAEFVTWLTAQVPGSVLVRLVADGDPDWLTGGKRLDEDPSKMRLVRSGFAFAFRLLVREPSGREHRLGGVFTWVLWALDTAEPRQQVWIDLGGDLKSLGKDGALKARIYQDRRVAVPSPNTDDDE